MGTISNKIEYLEGTKEAIKTAIKDKGIAVSDTDTFRSYATKISQIDGGSSLTFDAIYPVGSIYMSVNATSPDTLFGGSWQKIEGKFLLGADDSYTLNSEGGETEHILTVMEMPSHQHDFRANNSNTSGTTSYPHFTNAFASQNTSSQLGFNPILSVGGGQAHNNMPPYLAVNIWKRTA